MTEQKITKTNNRVCAICGRLIGKTHKSKDHIIPRAIAKWAYAVNENLTEKEFEKICQLIKSTDNKCMTHRKCNEKKSDRIINTKNLYINKQQHETLEQIKNELKPYIESFEIFKSSIYKKQNRCCHLCHRYFKPETMIIRRRNNKQDYAKDNACLVCPACNIRLTETRLRAGELYKYRKKFKKI